MPRNSSGDYSLPAGSLVSTGDTLLVSQHNPPFQDIANSISSSLDRDGRAIGTIWGGGNGSTTFNLPDTRGRVSAGREDMATPATTRLNDFSSSTLGAGFGSQSHTLTSAQMPTHTHTVTDPGHTHSYNRAAEFSAYAAGVGSGAL